MNMLVLMLGIVAVPAIVLTALRINAVIVLLALCLGAVLVQLAGSDAGSFVNLFTTSKIATEFGSRLILLLIPPIFAAIVLIGTVHSKLHTLLNMVPALCVGLIGLLLAEPLLAPGLRSNIAATSAWHTLQMLQSLIVAIVAILSLAFLALQRPGHVGRPGKHRSSR